MPAAICSSTLAVRLSAILETDAAGIDQLEIPVVVANQIAQPVARDARRLVDDGQPLVRQPIEKARFADIRPADDHDLGNAHGKRHSFEGAALAGPAGIPQELHGGDCSS